MSQKHEHIFSTIPLMKNKSLNQWLWKWHFIAGLVSLPFVLMLSITGIIYLFRPDYEEPRQQHIKKVEVLGTQLSLEKQLQIAKSISKHPINSVEISTTPDQATAFVSGRFGGKSTLYINPYTGQNTGRITIKKTDMNKVRKLHGELLTGKFGTKIIELIASWMFVLILTGLYVWWPQRGWQLKGYFIPRTNLGKRTLYRDIHAIGGFWVSILLLMTLAGGMPWTDVFGNNFKTVQKATHTGFPPAWMGIGVTSNATNGKIVSLDAIKQKVDDLQLKGLVSIELPKNSKGTYAVSNIIPQDLASMEKVHFDQYSGQKVMHLNWDDIGFLMKGRLWFMAFHQGEFGTWNWIIMFFTALLLMIMSIAAIVSYLLRKSKGNWGIPKVPTSFKTGKALVCIIIILGIVFPLFGISAFLIWIWEFFYKRQRQSIIN